MKQAFQPSRIKPPIRQMARYLIPFYPLFVLLLSMRRTMYSGVPLLRHQWMSHRDQENPERILTFSEALACRSADALPLDEIERLSLKRKRIALISAFFALCSLIGSVLGGRFFPACMSLLALLYCALALIKYAHRTWQIERGRLRPDCPMASLREFLARPNVGWYLLSHRLFD